MATDVQPPEQAQPSAPSDDRLRIVYEEVRDQVDGQLRNIEAHDAKAGILTALSGALFVALLAFALTGDLTRPRHGELTLLVLGAFATVVSIGAALFGLWPRTWHRDPEPTRLIGEYESARYVDADALLRQLTGNLRANYAQNLAGIEAKTRALYGSLVALIVALLFGIAVAIAHAAGW